MHVCHAEIRQDDLLPLLDMDWYTLSLVVMAVQIQWLFLGACGTIVIYGGELLVYASCSMMVSFASLVRLLTLNCSIVAPSPSTTAAARSEKSAKQGSGLQF